MGKWIFGDWTSGDQPSHVLWSHINLPRCLRQLSRWLGPASKKSIWVEPLPELICGRKVVAYHVGGILVIKLRGMRGFQGKIDQEVGKVHGDGKQCASCDLRNLIDRMRALGTVEPRYGCRGAILILSSDARRG